MFFIVPPFAFLLAAVYLMEVFSPLLVLIPAFIGITLRYGRSPFCPKCRIKLAVSW